MGWRSTVASWTCRSRPRWPARPIRVTPTGTAASSWRCRPPAALPTRCTSGPETLNAAFVPSGGTAASITATASVSTDTVTSLGPYLYDEGAFINVALPNTTSTVNGVSCVNSGSVECIVTGQAPNSASAPNTAPDATLSVLSGSTWTSSTLPNGVSQIESVACGEPRALESDSGPVAPATKARRSSTRPRAPERGR